MTFRKPALSVFASAALAVTVIGMAVMVASDMQDLFAAAIVLSLFAHLFWPVGWHSAVRLPTNTTGIRTSLWPLDPGRSSLSLCSRDPAEPSPGRRTGAEGQRARRELDVSGRSVARLWPDFESKLLLGGLRRGSAVGSLTW